MILALVLHELFHDFLCSPVPLEYSQERVLVTSLKIKVE